MEVDGFADVLLELSKARHTRIRWGSGWLLYVVCFEAFLLATEVRVRRVFSCFGNCGRFSCRATTFSDRQSIVSEFAKC